jgi:transcriptional regulator with GAF, ATPase, and Fis domain
MQCPHGIKVDTYTREQCYVCDLRMNTAIKAHIRKVLAIHDMVYYRAAKALGMSVKTLRSVLKRYGLYEARPVPKMGRG